MSGLMIRPVVEADHAAILDLVPRLAATGTPAGREQAEVQAADLSTLHTALSSPSPDIAIFVACEGDTVLGFIHLRTVVDYYSQSAITHVSDIVVATGAEGRGIGRRLMDRADEWARQRGHAFVQLYVLPENTPARTLYERAGFRPEWLKYIKPVG